MGEDQAVGEDQAEVSVVQETPSETAERAVAERLIRVLAIDDSAEIRELITCALPREHGFAVATACNGAEGLEVYYRERPDCVIVDVAMPVMTGFQFLRALRGDSETAQAPAIILSALDTDAHREAGALSGVDYYLQKPFKVTHLEEIIRQVMGIAPEERARRQEELAREVSGRETAATMGG